MIIQELRSSKIQNIKQENIVLANILFSLDKLLISFNSFVQIDNNTVLSKLMKSIKYKTTWSI